MPSSGVLSGLVRPT